MGSRKSPSGPRSSVTGFVTIAQTVINAGTAGNVATATGILQQFVSPGGSVATRVDPRLLSTNDVVAQSPRGTVPIATSQVAISYARISSIGTASAVVELGFANTSTASATVVANTFNLQISLQRADL